MKVLRGNMLNISLLTQNLYIVKKRNSIEEIFNKKFGGEETRTR